MEICSVSVSLAVVCESCNTAVPVNGITTKVKCQGCQEIIPLSGKFKWTKVLNYHNPSIDVFSATLKHKYGTGDYGAWISAKLNTMHSWPHCFKCNFKFEQIHIEKAIEGKLELDCPKCSHTMQIKEVPSFFKQAFPVALFAIDYMPSESGTTDNRIIHESKPVVIKCMSCGGSLQIDGSERLIECEYCHSANYLPDDLWLSIHQMPKRLNWYIIFNISVQGTN